jgi:hypothetical protein
MYFLGPAAGMRPGLFVGQGIAGQQKLNWPEYFYL